MFDGLFGWLRRSVHAAVIGGVQDAITDLSTTPCDAGERPVLQLVFRAPEVKPEPKKVRKAE